MRTIILISLVCLLAFVFVLRSGSARKRRHNRRIRSAEGVRNLLAEGALLPAQAVSYLRKVNPYTFEELVLDGFLRDGYKVKRNKRYSGDGGIDGRASKDGEEYLVQSKRYRGYISRQHVEDFSRVCTRERLKGFFVHTGKTGDASWETAGTFGNVDIVSGDRMLRLVGYQNKQENQEFFHNQSSRI